MIKRLLTGAAVLALALIVLGLNVRTTGTASAADPTPTPTLVPAASVDTGAVVTGGSSPPIVNEKWELPDMDPTTGIQYCFGQSGCQTDLNNNDIYDADDEPLMTGMQMYPNLCDQPEVRQIEFWIAAEDPDGLGDIAAVWSDVWEPPTEEGTCLDGSNPIPVSGLTGLWCWKYQVELDQVQCDEVGQYDDSVTPAILVVGPALLAAVDTDQVTMAEAQQIVIRCHKHEKNVYKAVQLLHHHQPAGTYAVIGSAQDWGAGLGILINYFQVMPIIGLQIDFTVVDWGSILPNQTDWVSGDEDLTTPAKPTVKDCGNVNMAVGLHFSEMLKVGDASKKITSFDAKFMGDQRDFVASVPQWFNTCAIPCHPKQLDLSIHPPDKLPPGVYAGTLDIYAAICVDE